MFNNSTDYKGSCDNCFVFCAGAAYRCSGDRMKWCKLILLSKQSLRANKLNRDKSVEEMSLEFVQKNVLIAKRHLSFLE